ncbi:hypothetical protein ACFVZR_38635 [Streptomyces sp. NPDC058316]|uniref:hypothetical protein n=1 Tax=unclassified Streptomyces TaxID=2593676 RepID=UPI00332A0AA6
MAPREPEESREGGGARQEAAAGGAVSAESAVPEPGSRESEQNAPERPGAAPPPMTNTLSTGSAPVPVVSGDPAAAPASDTAAASDGARKGTSAAASAATGAKSEAKSGAKAAAQSGAAASASAAAVASSGPRQDAATEKDGPDGPTGRVSKPMAAAAALAGVLLLCSPFLIAGLVGHHSDDNSPRAGDDYTGKQGGPGLVPGTDQAQGEASGGGHGGDSSSSGGGAVPPDGDQANDHHSASPAYYAVAGPYCSDKSTGYKEQGRYADGQSGWTTQEGSYAGGGCGGRFTSVPMSGHNGDDGNYALWTFRTAPVKSGSCEVKVFVPGDGNVGHVGGHPSHYSVYKTVDGSGKQLSDFTVDQVRNRGKWVSGGSFDSSNGAFSVKLHTRGVDYGSGYQNAHHAAAAISLECSA